MNAALRTTVEKQVAYLDRLIRVHAGGLVLESISAQGTVRVRFTGMCAGCENRPVTAIGTIRPALMTLEGVRAVEIVGARISQEAERRIEEDLMSDQSRSHVIRVIGLLDKSDRTASMAESRPEDE